MTDKLFTIGLALLVMALFAVVIFAMSTPTEEETTCAEKGGRIVRTRHGLICAKIDVIKL